MCFGSGCRWNGIKAQFVWHFYFILIIIIQFYCAKINSVLHVASDVGANTKWLLMNQAVIGGVMWGINYTPKRRQAEGCTSM